MNGGATHAMVALFTVAPPIALLLLIGLWVFAVIRLRNVARQWLVGIGIVVFGLAIFLFGGQWLLLRLELAWRLWVKLVLAVLLWFAGLTVGVLTVWYIPQTVGKAGNAVRGGLRVAAAVCLMIVMWFGTIWGGIWVSPAQEEVTAYHGVKAVEETSHWLDEICVIYEYRGPFVRGAEPIGPIGG